jgi:hypothetical protein
MFYGLRVSRHGEAIVMNTWLRPYALAVWGASVLGDVAVGGTLLGETSYAFVEIGAAVLVVLAALCYRCFTLLPTSRLREYYAALGWLTVLEAIVWFLFLYPPVRHAPYGVKVALVLTLPILVIVHQFVALLTLARTDLARR